MTEKSPEELAEGLESVIMSAEPALTDEELDAIGEAIDHLRQNKENGNDS